jgi:hypothetical protein
MSTLKTTLSGPGHRRSIRHLTRINPPALPNQPARNAETPNEPSPIFEHLTTRTRRLFPADTRQPAGRASIDNIEFCPRNQHNTKQNPPRLSVSASKKPYPRHPLNHETPNEPSPIFGQSATHPPLPPPLFLTSSPSKTLQLRVISKSPRLRVEDPLPKAEHSLPKPKTPPSSPTASRIVLTRKLLYTRSIRFVSGEMSDPGKTPLKAVQFQVESGD